MSVVASGKRDKQGRFQPAYDRVSLYGVVREVALAAGLRRPELISQRVWDSAREASPHPHATPAREICRQLSKGNGEPFPWRQLVEAALDDQREDERVDVGIRGTEDVETDLFTPEAIAYALRRVAAELKTDELSLVAYRQAREGLIAADERRRDGGFLADLLPTFPQIIRFAGSWSAAVRLAGLSSPPTIPLRRRGVPIVEAGMRFYRTTGFLPTHRQLMRFARDHGFSLQARVLHFLGFGAGSGGAR